MIFSTYFSSYKVLKNIGKNLRFIAITIALGLMAILYFSKQKATEFDASNTSYFSSIATKVAAEQSAILENIRNVVRQIKTGKARQFSDFAVEHHSPYFVFENQKLVYWSTNDYAPTLYEFRAFSKKGYGNTPAGQFIISGRSFRANGHVFEVYSLSFLKRNYTFENDYLRSGFNDRIFEANPLAIYGIPSSDIRKNINGQDGKFLFSVEPPIQKLRKKTPFTVVSLVVIMLSALSILLLVWFGNRQNEYIKNAISVFFVIAVVRFLMLYFDVPQSIVETTLFNSKNGGFGIFSPTIGDLIINLILSIFGAYFLIKCHKSLWLYQQAIALKPTWKSVVGLGLIGLGFSIFSSFVKIFRQIYVLKIQGFSMGIDNHFNTYKIYAVLIFILSGILFFLVNHLLINVFTRILNTQKLRLQTFVVGAVIGLIYYMAVCREWLAFWLVLYWLVVVYFKFYRNFFNFRYAISIYLFVSAFLVALAGFYVHFTETRQQEIINKKWLASRVLADNDLMAEGLLNKASQLIAVDSTIIKSFQNTDFAREIVRNRILDKHLDPFFNKFDTEVLLFDPKGQAIANGLDAKTIDFYNKLKEIEEYKTQYSNVLFFESLRDSIQQGYLVFVPITDNGQNLGDLVLKMSLTVHEQQGTYPDFLKNRRVLQTANPQDYSFAVFLNGQLKQQVGTYNYLKNFDRGLLSSTALFEDGISQNAFHHLGVSKGVRKTIIISSKKREMYRTVADFSFLFMMLSIAILLYILAYSLQIRKQGLNLNFGTRIQTYINSAFILPLILLVLVTISVVSALFVQNQKRAYLQNSQNIAQTIKPLIEQYTKGLMSTGYLEQEITSLAKDLGEDINIYAPNGQLLASTKPMIFEYHIFSKNVNPLAYNKLFENQDVETLEPETIGILDFNTAYVSLNGLPGYIVGIPFYDSKVSIDSQLANIVSSILSLFSIIFISLLILSYFASKVLTVPLRLITEKIQKINLNNKNEALKWSANDEIGVLVSEYNRMLKKLEESKEALAASQKQTAWREMAKQVAHEIKNPLTPMKLSVQQLQRTLSLQEDPRTKEKIDRALQSLIKQIDTISDIAQSFSDFAKMPVPRSEEFDMVDVLQGCANLYADDDRISVNAYIREEHAMVIGDKNLISRIITNLIINGIQSVPASKRPIINLRLYRSEEEETIIMEVQDNGQGIPESIRQKIFVPNFSTKAGGSGLGLAMAKRGIEHANGNLWFETHSDKGTTFFIDLPLSAKTINNVDSKLVR